MGVLQLILWGHDVNCSEIRGKKPPTHRIAFNSLYLFSSKSITYEANGEALYDSRAENSSARPPSRRGPLGSAVFPRLCAQKTFGRRGLHDA